MHLPASLQSQDIAVNAEEFSIALALTQMSFVWILQLSQLQNRVNASYFVLIYSLKNIFLALLCAQTLSRVPAEDKRDTISALLNLTS